jgi:pilus assembly protein CpaD
MLRSTVLAATALASLLVAGCAHEGPGENARAKAATTPSQLYKLQAEDQTDQILLAVHTDGLSPAQDEAVRALADRWRDGGGRSIQIDAPQDPADSTVAYRAAQTVRQRLIAAGVPAAAIEQHAYDATGDAKAPLKVSFVHFQADVPACGQSWEDLTATKNNAVQSNFGCAVTANIAAMIADPADIAAPRQVGSADAGRRVTVMQTYRKGEVTSAAADSKASGVISNAIP